MHTRLPEMKILHVEGSTKLSCYRFSAHNLKRNEQWFMEFFPFKVGLFSCSIPVDWQNKRTLRFVNGKYFELHRDELKKSTKAMYYRLDIYPSTPTALYNVHRLSFPLVHIWMGISFWNSEFKDNCNELCFANIWKSSISKLHLQDITLVWWCVSPLQRIYVQEATTPLQQHWISLSFQQYHW